MKFTPPDWIKIITKIIHWPNFKNTAVKFPTSEVRELNVCLSNKQLFQKDRAFKFFTWLVGWSVGWLFPWLVGWLFGRSVGRSVGSLVGWLNSESNLSAHTGLKIV
jgi:hypothetical protein